MATKRCLHAGRRAHALQQLTRACRTPPCEHPADHSLQAHDSLKSLAPLAPLHRSRLSAC
eukprot:2517162-Pleurochrysis_carterae.AAC.1